MDTHRYSWSWIWISKAFLPWSDRNGKHFGAILNYLRDGTIPLPETRRELMELQVKNSWEWVIPFLRTSSAETPTTGWGQVLLCGWAGAWHWAESWKTWSGGRQRSNGIFLNKWTPRARMWCRYAGCPWSPARGRSRPWSPPTTWSLLSSCLSTGDVKSFLS